LEVNHGDQKNDARRAETIANQEIKRLGGYNKYRQQSMDIPSDTEGGLLTVQPPSPLYLLSTRRTLNASGDHPVSIR
jgi:hypothetical protein